MTDINSNLINDDNDNNDNIDSQDLHSIYNDNYNKNVDLYPIHSRNNKHYIKNRITKFFKFDSIRITKIFEIIQYTLLYCFFCFTLGIIFNKIFFKYDQKKKIFIQILQTVIQLVICSISIFYIKKIVKIVPLIYKGPKHYKPYTTKEYIGGGIIFGIVFLRLQTNLLDRLGHINKWLSVKNVVTTIRKTS